MAASDGENPFANEVEDVPDAILEEFPETKFNSSAQDDFKVLASEKLWMKYLPVYP